MTAMLAVRARKEDPLAKEYSCSPVLVPEGPATTCLHKPPRLVCPPHQPFTSQASGRTWNSPTANPPPLPPLPPLPHSVESLGFLLGKTTAPTTPMLSIVIVREEGMDDLSKAMIALRCCEILQSMQFYTQERERERL